MPSSAADAALVYGLATLGLAALLDLLYQEVDPEYWFLAIPPAVPLGAYLALETPFPHLVYLLNAVLVLLVAGLYLAGYMGGADLGAVALAAAATPVVPGGLLPTVYLAVLYSAPAAAAYYAFRLYRACHAGCLRRLGLEAEGRRIVEMKWWVPRLGQAPLAEDAHETLALRNLWSERVRASPLIPWVTVFYAGYLAAAVLGEEPILALLGVAG